MKKEIEILYSIESTPREEIINAFSAFNFMGEKKTLDIYFFDPKRNNLRPDHKGRLFECSRIRKKGDKSFITYKKDIFDNTGVWQHSDEIETEIKDHQEGIEFVKSHGLEELVRVVNNKTIFETSEYEIVYEEVEGLGRFLEVEKKEEIDEDLVAAEKEKIRNFVTSLGIEIGEELNSGKPELLIKKNISPRAFISYKLTSSPNRDDLKKKLRAVQGSLESLGYSTYCSIDDVSYFDNKKWDTGRVTEYINQKIVESDIFVMLVDDEMESKGMILELGYAIALEKKIILIRKQNITAAFESAFADIEIPFTKIQKEDLSKKIRNHLS